VKDRRGEEVGIDEEWDRFVVFLFETVERKFPPEFEAFRRGVFPSGSEEIFESRRHR